MENDNLFLWLKAAVTAFAGAFGAAFGWLGWLVVAWVVCMALDWLSGSAAAAALGANATAKKRAVQPVVLQDAAGRNRPNVR